MIEDDWATHWLDVTGMELDENEPARRRDRKWNGDHKGAKLPELPKGAATDDLFRDLEKAMNDTAAPAATATAAAPHGYRTDEEGKLPHISEMACPVSMLTMGKLTEQVRTLWDSGAYYNLMPLRMARKLGLDVVQTGRLPTLEMANSVLTQPLGRAHVPVTWGPHVAYPTEFFVLETCPYDSIMGSHFVKRCKGAIDYNTEAVRLSIENSTVHIPFETKTAKIYYREAAALYVVRPVTIPPNTERDVEVQFSAGSNELPGTWGWVADAQHQPVYVMRGFTCTTGADSTAAYRCRVTNPQTDM